MPSTPGPGLEQSLLALSEREAVLARAGELMLEAWRSFDHPRAGQPKISDNVRQLLAGDLPEVGEAATSALEQAAAVLDASLAQSRPRFFAYVASSGLEIGVLGDALMASHDVNVAVPTGAAGLLEEQVIRWVATFVGFGACGGLLASGGMISNLTALATAREHAAPGTRTSGIAGRQLRILCSSETHYSVCRAAEVLGLGANGVRVIPVDSAHRIDVAATAAAIEEERTSGSVVVAVVATAGTTLTGAVDDIAGLAAVCRDRDVWLHVDGAYGLPAASTARAGWRFKGLDLADSATVDAHKWMYVPKACSVLLVRDPSALTRSFSHEQSYMPHLGGVEEHPVDQTLEYSRPLRSLKLWLAFKTHGAAALRAAIERNLNQAQLLAELVEARPRFELLLRPQLSTVCFRHLPAVDLDVNDYHARLARALQEDGMIYLAPAALDDQICLRACFVNHRTVDDDVHAVLEAVESASTRLLGS
jgi:aromatic-L-amino-acid decarboxylase